MGTSLNGLTPAGTYPGLIKTGDNTELNATLKTLSDGNGNNLPIAVSTTTVNFTNQLQQGGVAVPTALQVAAKQDTLVSGTNIKTINGASVLGSGNIAVVTSPSGVSGAIQFSDGSAFASDAANFFWDNTNKRLGVGTNAPTTTLHIVGQTTFSDNALFSADFKYIGRDLNNSSIRFSQVSGEIRANISTGGQFHIYNSGSGTSRFAVSSGGQTTINGGGSTFATNSFLVQNSSGANLMRIRDDGQVFCEGGGAFSSTGIIGTAYGLFGGASYEASASLVCGGTTQGFLPPRMTTTQKNAIASPATGLVVYDSTTNKLQCYNGSTWNDLF